MNYLLKSIKIIDPSSPYNSKIMDIELINGKIGTIAPTIQNNKNYKEISGIQLAISKGWIDLNAQSGEPLNATAESIDSFVKSAMKGGFTHVAHFPNVDTPAERKSDISFISNYNSKAPITILPIGSISQSAQPKQLAEMLEMKQEGALAYTNGNTTSLKSDILINALNYSKAFEGKIMVHAEKSDLSNNGQVNQGIHSVMTGFKGIPKEAEFLAVRETIDLAKYCNHEIMLLNISTAESLDAIKEAKKNGQKVYCGVNSMHLLYDDRAILDYNTHYKINPPLRSEKDKKRLRKAVMEGLIDVIYSQHTPKVVEEKFLEFDLAAFGIVHLQTTFLATIKALGIDAIESIVQCMSHNPAAYLGIYMPAINENITGSFTIFDLGQKTAYTPSIHASKSSNTPFFDMELEGKVLGVVTKGAAHFF